MSKSNGKALHGDILGFIGKGMEIEGRLSFEEIVRVEGRFNGEVAASGTLVVGEEGSVEGEIKVGVAIVAGYVKGTITATERVELQGPARVFGDIRTPNLVIGEGVIFEGHCIMTKQGGYTVSPQEVVYDTDRRETEIKTRFS